MVIYVSHQFPFPPSQGSPFVIVITKGMRACWLTDDPDKACTQALLILYTYAFACVHKKPIWSPGNPSTSDAYWKFEEAFAPIGHTQHGFGLSLSLH